MAGVIPDAGRCGRRQRKQSPCVAGASIFPAGAPAPCRPSPDLISGAASDQMNTTNQLLIRPMKTEERTPARILLVDDDRKLASMLALGLSACAVTTRS